MVELLNSKNFKLDISNSSNDEPNLKLPPLKKKVRRKIPIPHYPNVDRPMTEKEILDFKKKYPNRKIDFKNPKPEGSEQIELKNMFGSTNNLGSTDINDNFSDIVSVNSIVGDVYLEEDRTNNYIRGYCYHKLGKCYSFCADKRGNPLIIIGRRWYIYFCITIILHTIMWFFLFYYKRKLKEGVRISAMIFILIFQIIYTLVYISNPGFPRNTIGRMKGTPKEEHKYCSECLFYNNINQKTHHCFTCGICIEGYKRHSYLINKCIGSKNKILFYIMIGFLIANIIYIIVIICLVNK